MFGHDIPAGLTVRDRKRRLYGADLYFKEGWAELSAHEPDAAALAAAVRRHAVLVLKPDAVAGRRLGAAVGWLADQGFTVAAAEPCRPDRHVLRALWTYQWNIATRERTALTEAYFGLGTSLLLLVSGPVRPVPATVRLSDLKGSADPAGVRPGQLRHVLGSRDHVVNGVHSTDEPADVVRELSVLLDPEPRARAVAALVGGATADPGPAVAAAYAQTPENDPRWADLLAGTARMRLNEDGLERILPGVSAAEWIG